MERGFLQSLRTTASAEFVAAAAVAILAYGVFTTIFQYWIVTLVEEQVRRRNRPTVALVNLALMPAGQALLLAVFFGVIESYLPRPHLSSSLTTSLPRMFPLWVTALSGFFFGGLLLAVLPWVGKYLREPEISVFCGGLFIVVAYEHPGLTSGLRAMWVFCKHHFFIAFGLLVFAKAISLACRYAIILLMARAKANQRPKQTPRLPLALALGTSSTLMLVALLALLTAQSFGPR